MSTPSEQTLLVTGSNGYIGGHVLKQALEKGYHVRGVVRAEKSSQKFAKLFSSYGSKLSFAVVPDLSVPSDWESAFANPTKPITGLLHLASHFSFKVQDNKRDLLDPAVKGTVAALDAAKAFGGSSLRRFVLTSSFAAILDTAKGARPGYTYTEKDWNPAGWEAADADVSTAYCASKKLAEEAAWKWMETNKPGFTLTALDPAWVFGPQVGGLDSLTHLNQSSETLLQLLDAKTVPSLDFAAYIDVRDIAAAHILAFETQATAGERLLCGSHFGYQAACDMLREALPELKSRIPQGTPGRWGESYKADGSKAEKVLGLKYTPLSVSMKDAFVQFLEAEKKSAAAAA